MPRGRRPSSRRRQSPRRRGKPCLALGVNGRPRQPVSPQAAEDQRRERHNPRALFEHRQENEGKQRQRRRRPAPRHCRSRTAAPIQQPGDPGDGRKNEGDAVDDEEDVAKPVEKHPKVGPIVDVVAAGRRVAKDCQSAGERQSKPRQGEGNGKQEAADADKAGLDAARQTPAKPSSEPAAMPLKRRRSSPRTSVAASVRRRCRGRGTPARLGAAASAAAIGRRRRRRHRLASAAAGARGDRVLAGSARRGRRGLRPLQSPSAAAAASRAERPSPSRSRDTPLRAGFGLLGVHQRVADAAIEKDRRQLSRIGRGRLVLRADGVFSRGGFWAAAASAAARRWRRRVRTDQLRADFRGRGAHQRAAEAAERGMPPRRRRRPR